MDPESFESGQLSRDKWLQNTNRGFSVERRYFNLWLLFQNRGFAFIAPSTLLQERGKDKERRMLKANEKQTKRDRIHVSLSTANLTFEGGLKREA